ncbi:hypothetical protein [Vibrio owensii]|uniref:hypothetical protein n=1 Tax=Vibrio owensii TaxID=696485 RepID=UPI003CC5DE1C
MIRREAEVELKRQQAKLVVFEQGQGEDKLIRFGLMNGENKALAYLDIQKWRTNFHVNSSAAHKGLGHAIYLFAMMYLQEKESGAGLFSNRFHDCTNDAIKMWESLSKMNGLEVSQITDPDEISFKALKSHPEQLLEQNPHITKESLSSMSKEHSECVRGILEHKDTTLSPLNQIYKAKPTRFYDALCKRGAQLCLEERREALRAAAELFDDMYELGRSSVSYPSYPERKHDLSYA